jgi:hypothetical protein
MQCRDAEEAFRNESQPMTEAGDTPSKKCLRLVQTASGADAQWHQVKFHVLRFRHIAAAESFGFSTLAMKETNSAFARRAGLSTAVNAGEQTFGVSNFQNASLNLILVRSGIA